MSYEDLEEARAKRVEKESTQETKGKGRRGRKRKSGTPEADESIADKARRGRKRKSAALEAEALEPKATKIISMQQRKRKRQKKRPSLIFWDSFASFLRPLNLSKTRRA